MTARSGPQGERSSIPTIFQQQILVIGVMLVLSIVPALFEDVVGDFPFTAGWLLLLAATILSAVSAAPRVTPLLAPGLLLIDIVAVAAIGSSDPTLSGWFATTVPIICLARAPGGRAAVVGPVLAVVSIAIGGLWAYFVSDVDLAHLLGVGLAAVVVASVAAAHLNGSRRKLSAQATLLQRQAIMLEDALEQARSDGRRVQEILDTVDFSVVTLAPESGRTHLNATAKKMMSKLGFPQDSQLDQLPAYHLDGTTPIVADDWAKVIQGEVEALGLWLGHPGGPRVALSVTASVVGKEPNASARTVIAARDITTERRALEARDDMVTSLSHELRTPLSSILGYLDLVVEDPRLSDQHRDLLGVALRNANRMLSLVSDLLHARSDAATAGLTITVTSCDVVKLLRDGVESVRPMAADRLIAVSIDSPETLQIEADPFRLRHVIDNLMSNAVKYNEAGGWIDITLASVPKGYVTLSVTNTGHALTPEEQARLFERFYRSESARGSTVHGTGVGLSIAREIVDLHGGSVDVESSPDSNTTTLTVVLPVEQDDPESDDDDD